MPFSAPVTPFDKKLSSNTPISTRVTKHTQQSKIVKAIHNSHFASTKTQSLVLHHPSKIHRNPHHHNPSSLTASCRRQTLTTMAKVNGSTSFPQSVTHKTATATERVVSAHIDDEDGVLGLSVFANARDSIELITRCRRSKPAPAEEQRPRACRRLLNKTRAGITSFLRRIGSGLKRAGRDSTRRSASSMAIDSFQYENEPYDVEALFDELLSAIEAAARRGQFDDSVRQARWDHTLLARSMAGQ